MGVLKKWVRAPVNQREERNRRLAALFPPQKRLKRKPPFLKKKKPSQKILPVLPRNPAKRLKRIGMTERTFTLETTNTKKSLVMILNYLLLSAKAVSVKLCKSKRKIPKKSSP